MLYISINWPIEKFLGFLIFFIIVIIGFWCLIYIFFILFYWVFFAIKNSMQTNEDTHFNEVEHQKFYKQENVKIIYKKNNY